MQSQMRNNSAQKRGEGGGEREREKESRWSESEERMSLVGGSIQRQFFLVAKISPYIWFSSCCLFCSLVC